MLGLLILGLTKVGESIVGLVEKTNSPVPVKLDTLADVNSPKCFESIL